MDCNFPFNLYSFKMDCNFPFNLYSFKMNVVSVKMLEELNMIFNYLKVGIYIVYIYKKNLIVATEEKCSVSMFSLIYQQLTLLLITKPR